MGKLKWTDEFLAEVARDLFNRHGGMVDGIVPGLTAVLFFVTYAQAMQRIVWHVCLLGPFLADCCLDGAATTLVEKDQFKGFTTNECQNQVWMSFALVSKTMASKYLVKVKRIKGNTRFTRSWCSSG